MLRLRLWMATLCFATLVPAVRAQQSATCPANTTAHTSDNGATWCMDSEGRSFALENSAPVPKGKAAEAEPRNPDHLYYNGEDLTAKYGLGDEKHEGVKPGVVSGKTAALKFPSVNFSLPRRTDFSETGGHQSCPKEFVDLEFKPNIIKCGDVHGNIYSPDDHAVTHSQLAIMFWGGYPRATEMYFGSLEFDRSRATGGSSNWYQNPQTRTANTGDVTFNYRIDECTEYPSDGLSGDELFRRADQAYESGDGLKALCLGQKSAELGNFHAYNLLGLLYTHSDNGSGEYAKAAKLFRMAADRGSHWGEYYLSMCYENGIGVEQDPVQMHDWRRRALVDGDVTVYDGQRVIKAMFGGGDPFGSDASGDQAKHDQLERGVGIGSSCAGGTCVTRVPVNPRKYPHN